MAITQSIASQLTHFMVRMGVTLFLTLCSMAALHSQQGCIEITEPLALFIAADDPDGLCSPTLHKESALFLTTNEIVKSKLQTTRPDLWTLAVSLPDGTHEWVEMHRFLAHTVDFEIGHMTKDGVRTERYTPQLLTYRFGTAGFNGTLVIMEDEIAGTLRHKGVQYENVN